jgi:hypothetical protein
MLMAAKHRKLTLTRLICKSALATLQSINFATYAIVISLPRLRPRLKPCPSRAPSYPTTAEEESGSESSPPASSKPKTRLTPRNFADPNCVCTKIYKDASAGDLLRWSSSRRRKRLPMPISSKRTLPSSESDWAVIRGQKRHLR